MIPRPSFPRRYVVALAVVTLGAAAATLVGDPGVAHSAPAPAPSAALDPRDDWNFLVGHWNVHHRRLKTRVRGGGSNEWIEFGGTNTVWKTMDGLGVVDDNVIDAPAGTYHAMTVRGYDTKSQQWSIWWIETRYAGIPIDPPVRGGFKDGVGTFYADVTIDDEPVRVRFLWSHITPTSARWEQAFSWDGGTTWEPNWIWDLTRADSAAGSDSARR